MGWIWKARDFKSSLTVSVCFFCITIAGWQALRRFQRLRGFHDDNPGLTDYHPGSPRTGSPAGDGRYQRHIYDP